MATVIVVEDLAAPASIGRGGHAMYVLQWLHGLARLGHHVIFVEYLDQPAAEVPDSMISYFDGVISRWWQPHQTALISEPSLRSLYGLSADEVSRLAGEASALLTLAAHFRRDPYPFVDGIRPRILIEQDPGYTHLWAQSGDPLEIFGEHDRYYTVGANIGTPRCALPTLGMTWRHAWNPVVLDWWEASVSGGGGLGRFATVADWRSYGYLEYEGRLLGPKAEEFRAYIDLPRLAGEPIELVLNIDADDPDREYLRDNGWLIEDPTAVSSPERYRAYIAASAGEFSCVKGGYAGTRGGWFSDRSACYLAAGRPVVLEATGFEDVLPVGMGLFSVRSPEEASEAIRQIRRDYRLHSAAARELAREHFDSDKVLAQLLRDAGIEERCP